MINSKAFKTIRKAKGYTQKSLAKGITTQGTISRMEKSSVEPSRKIMDSLADRLEVDVNDLIVHGQAEQVTQSLKKADNLYKNYEYQQVLDELNKYTPVEFSNISADVHYTFLKTASQVWLNHDLSEGIFGFNTILQKNEFSIYTVLATMELAVVYTYQKNKARAEYYVAQVPEQLNRLSDEAKHLDPFWYAIIVENLARYYLHSARLKASQFYAKSLIDFLNEINSSYNLESAYLTLSSATSELDGNTQAVKRQLITAWTLALNANNEPVAKEAAKQMTILHISTFD
ncbi:MAG TPA: hypothetical protein DCW31_04865 [Lactobacillus sp.]|nr:hypothetical protein [Lactobacillus sp.]